MLSTYAYAVECILLICQLVPQHTKLFDLLELANWLTLVRLPLAAMLWIAPGNATWVCSLLAAAAISDMLDGRLANMLRARRLQHGSDPEVIDRAQAVGAWLDPLCDKTFVVSTLAVVYVGFQTDTWMLIAIAARELILVPTALVYRLSLRLRRIFRFDFRAGVLGKLATVAQFSTILMLILGAPYLTPAVVVTATIGVAAAIMYLRKAVLIARWIATNEFVSSRWEETQRKFNQDRFQEYSPTNAPMLR